MTRYSENSKATVNVSGDFGVAENLEVATVFGNTLKLSYANKLVEMSGDVIKELKTLTIKSKVGNFSIDDEIKVKINSDFEIIKTGTITGGTLKAGSFEEHEFVIKATGDNKEIKISGMEIEALDVKPDKIATITITSKGYESDAIDVAKVIADEVKMTVDEDEDIPVIYSGTNKNNSGLNTSNSHDALTVTIEETAVDSWYTKDKWRLILPDGVYVTDDSTFTSENIVSFKDAANVSNMFEKAYKAGDYETFDFSRHSFEIAGNQKGKIEFTLNLIAEPDFEGDVTVTLETDDSKQEVTIAKFIKPYSISSKQNDVSIDYRYTKLNSDIIINETEEDLWKENTEFVFDVEHMSFEDTTKYTSNFNIKDLKNKLGFKVDESSDDEAFKVVISNMSLYMDRNLPAGAYDLTLNTTMSNAFMDENVFGTTKKVSEVYYDTDSYDEVVKEDFVNIITGDADTFVTKVEVPVDKDYIKAGDKVFKLDVPAYINSNNYTMLPVRAVAVALGIDNDAIVWNAETRTATIFYGSRIISMTIDADTMTVNGTIIPTATSVEVVNGRMFIPMRDLATAMNAKLNWDAVNRIATFN